MPSEEQVQSAVRSYIEHLGSRNRDRWLEVFAADAVVTDPVPGEPAVGRTAIGEFYDGLLAMADNLTVSEHALHVCGEEAALVYTFTAGPADGGGVAFDGVGIFAVDDDGKITSLDAYWDPSTVHPA